MAYTSINALAVLVAAIAGMVIGALWYSPALFGRRWMQLMKMDKAAVAKAKRQGMTANYVAAFIGQLVTAAVLAMFVGYAGALGAGDGMIVGFLAWLGFLAPVILGSVLWEGKSMQLFVLNSGHHLVVLLVMGIILGAWA